jgi:hypothetical protein
MQDLAYSALSAALSKSFELALDRVQLLASDH